MSGQTIVPVFRRVDGDNPDGELNQWLASVPDTFNAAQARDAALVALRDARDRVGAVRDAYHGTLPPAPWPARPELVKATEAMEGARAFFAKIADAGGASTWTKTSKAWLALSRAGTNLYGELDHLEQASANAPTLAALLKAVPDPRELILGRFEVKKVALAGVLLWLFVPEVKRAVRRVLK